MNKNKGFTLIELLVVIAIIAVLSSVVMWFLTEAKNKNADAAVKQGLSTISNQAGIFYLDNESFVGFCSSSVAKSAYFIVLDAARKVELSTIVVNNVPSGGSSLGVATCNNSATNWAAEVPLKTETNKMFCVDSTGFVGITTSSIETNVACPQ